MALQDTIEQLNNIDINDWSRVGVWPLAARIFLWSLAMAAILASAYFFFVKDLQVKLDRSVAKESSLKRDFQGKAFQAATLSQYQQLMEKMEEDFQYLVSQLPEKTQVPGLLDDIDETGRDSGLTIKSIKLQPEVVGDVYVELPIEIQVIGSYHDFGSFISSIAGMSRIVTLHDYSIVPDKEKPTLLAMQISAKTYRYRSPSDGDEQ